MLIDAHTHIFPDTLAPKVLPVMAAAAKTQPTTEATLFSLTKSMQQNGVDYSLLLPVVTAPRQFDSINRFALSVTGRAGLISFGGIHPDCENVPQKLDWLRAQGFRGIKLHPDYQDCFIDDVRVIDLVRYAVSIGLYVTIHAGFDPVSPTLVHATPARSLRLIHAVNEAGAPHIILAHMGGSLEYDEVEETLIGQNVLLDTAYVADKIPPEQFLRMIRGHGTDRVLFASDSPWGDVGRFASVIRSLPLTVPEQEQILFRNAQKILF